MCSGETSAKLPGLKLQFYVNRIFDIGKSFVWQRTPGDYSLLVLHIFSIRAVSDQDRISFPLVRGIRTVNVASDYAIVLELDGDVFLEYIGVGRAVFCGDIRKSPEIDDGRRHCEI